MDHFGFSSQFFLSSFRLLQNGIGIFSSLVLALGLVLVRSVVGLLIPPFFHFFSPRLLSSRSLLHPAASCPFLASFLLDWWWLVAVPLGNDFSSIPAANSD